MLNAYQSNAKVELVLGQPSPRLAQEIAGFWVLHGAVGQPQEIRRRLSEVLLVLRAPDEALVAVTSVYPYPTSSPGRALGLRAFVAPEQRGLSFMMLMFDSMLAALHKHATEPTAVMFYAENRKLMQKGNRRWFERRGWRRLSADDAAQDEWLMRVGPGVVFPPRETRT